jgi:hypothetical protein
MIRSIALTVGYTFSYGQFGSSDFLILPYADLSFYFGKAMIRETGLFKKGW